MASLLLYRSQASRDVGLYVVAVATTFGFTPVTLAASVLSSYGQIRVAPTIAAVLALVAGTFICFFGYRLLRLTIFLCGFVLSGLIAALIIEFAFASFSWMPTASWIAFLIAGVGGGALAAFAYALGVFLVGALAGLMIAFVCQVSFAYMFLPSHPEIILVVLVIAFGLIGGVLTWKLEKPLLIIATSFVGATSMLWGVGYFAGKYPNAADLDRFRAKSHGKWVYDVPGAWWAYLTATLLLFVMGIWVQWRRSGKGIRHRSVHDRSGNPYHRADSRDAGEYARAQTPLPTTRDQAQRQQQQQQQQSDPANARSSHFNRTK